MKYRLFEMSRKKKAINNPQITQISNRDIGTYAIIGATIEVHQIMGQAFW